MASRYQERQAVRNRTGYVRGSLAHDLYSAHVQVSGAAAPERKPQIEVAPDYERVRKERVQEIARQRIQANLRKQYHLAGLKRRRQLSVALVAIMVLTGLFALALTRYARINEINLANAAMMENISELEKKNQEAKEKLLTHLDLSAIETEAYDKFKLKRPSQRQRVMMKLPDTDITSYYGQPNPVDSGLNRSTVEKIEYYMVKQIKDRD